MKQMVANLWPETSGLTNNVLSFPAVTCVSCGHVHLLPTAVPDVVTASCITCNPGGYWRSSSDLCLIWKSTVFLPWELLYAIRIYQLEKVIDTIPDFCYSLGMHTNLEDSE